MTVLKVGDRVQVIAPDDPYEFSFGTVATVWEFTDAVAVTVDRKKYPRPYTPDELQVIPDLRKGNIDLWDEPGAEPPAYVDFTVRERVCAAIVGVTLAVGAGWVYGLILAWAAGAL